MPLLLSILKQHNIDVVGYNEDVGLITVNALYSKDGVGFFVKETIPAKKQDVYEWLGY